MKKIFLGLVTFATVTANAQKKVDNEKMNNVKVNIASLLLSTAAVAYERQLSESTSAQLQVNYTGASIPGADTKIRGLMIIPEFRYYPKKEGFVGFYVAPYLRYQGLKLENIDPTTNVTDKATLNTFGGGVLLGKKWTIGSVSLEFFAGPQYNSGKIKTEGTATEDDFSFKGGLNGFGVRTGFTVGILF